MPSPINTTPLESQLRSLFPEFSPELIQFLNKNSLVKKLAEEDVLLYPGEKPEFAMLVLSGRIKILSRELEEEEATAWMYHVEPGQACAMSLFCINGNAATRIVGVAGATSEVLLIPARLISEIATKFPEWQTFTASVFRARFAELLESFEQIAFKSLDERLIHYLIRQSKAFKSDLIPLTHEQIASDLNSSRVVISRLLKLLEKEGKIKQIRQAVVLVREHWPAFN